MNLSGSVQGEPGRGVPRQIVSARLHNTVLEGGARPP
jgi:hypothetical protein